MTSSGPVGVGVIGAGNISTQYLDNLTTFPDLAVVFVADLDVGRAREQAAKYGIAASGTVDELLAHPEVEIVVNLTIPVAHVEVALAALAAGKNVWTEKPIGLDRASARTVLDSAAHLGLRAATAPDTFLGPGLQAAKRLIAEGRIGTPLTALAIFQASGPEAWHPNPDFLYATGAGPLFDMGPYYLTALVQNLGPVRRVAAQSSTSRQTRTIGSGPRAGEEFAVEVPTHFGALLEFESSASAQCIFSFQSGVRRNGPLEISGTLGTIAFPDPNGFDGEVTVQLEGFWRARRSRHHLELRPRGWRGRPRAIDPRRSARAGVGRAGVSRARHHGGDIRGRRGRRLRHGAEHDERATGTECRVGPPADDAVIIGLTGAAGAVGSRVAAHLAELGHRVVAIDRAGEHPVDAADYPALREALTDVDAIVHLAAINTPDASDVETNNRTANENVMRACVELGIPGGAPHDVLVGRAVVRFDVASGVLITARCSTITSTSVSASRSAG